MADFGGETKPRSLPLWGSSREDYARLIFIVDRLIMIISNFLVPIVNYYWCDKFRKAAVKLLNIN